MKRRTVRVIGCIVLLVGTLICPTVFAEDDGYAEVAGAIEHLLDRLEYVLMWSSWGTSSTDEDHMFLGAQGLVNRFEGPDGERYDVETGVVLAYRGSTDVHADGVESPGDALLPAFRALLRSRVSQFLDGESAVEFLRMQRNVEQLLDLAHQDAVAALEAIPDAQAYKDHMTHAYALLVMVRGSTDDRFIPQGLLAMASLVPSQRYLVEEGESIQAAIDRAPEGATILIGPGVFNEALTIKKSIHLVGSAELGGTLIEGGWQYARANAIDCSAPGEPISVSITGIALRGTEHVSGMYDWGTGIYAWGAVELTLSNVAIESFTNAGLVVSDTSRVHGSNLGFSENGIAIVLTDNVVCQIDGVRIEGSLSEQGAVLLTGAAKLSMSDATIADSTGDGILYEATTSIELNEVQLLRNGGYGVRMKDAVCEDDPDAPKLDYFEIQETYHVGGEGNVSPEPDEEDGNALGGFCPEILMILEYVSPY